MQERTKAVDLSGGETYKFVGDDADYSTMEFCGFTSTHTTQNGSTVGMVKLSWDDGEKVLEVHSSDFERFINEGGWVPV